MEETTVIKVIAEIRSDFPTKFGIPRQSGLVPELEALVVFRPEYRVPEALRGIEGYSHLWLLWEFSETKREGWRPTVRPPRLGGNRRVGVFASRSPFRPNAIGLSCVKLLGVVHHPEWGTVLRVTGAGLMDCTLIYRNADHLVLHLKTMYNITNICSIGSNGLQTRADFEKAKPLIDRACDEN